MQSNTLKSCVGRGGSDGLATFCRDPAGLVPGEEVRRRCRRANGSCRSRHRLAEDRGDPWKLAGEARGRPNDSMKRWFAAGQGIVAQTEAKHLLKLQLYSAGRFL